MQFEVPYQAISVSLPGWVPNVDTAALFSTRISESGSGTAAAAAAAAAATGGGGSSSNGIGAVQYVGESIKGQRNGRGTLSCRGVFTFDGSWRDNQRNGHGVFALANGDKYEGEWRNDLKDGYGVFTLANGSSYVGQWREDKLHGMGVHTVVRDGETFVYEGEHADGRKHGWGTLRWPSGASYHGQWEHNQIKGIGILTPPTSNTAGGTSSSTSSSTGSGVYDDRVVHFGRWDFNTVQAGFTTSSSGFWQNRHRWRNIWLEVYGMLHSIYYDSTDDTHPFWSHNLLQRVGDSWGGLINSLLEFIYHPMCLDVLPTFRILNLVAHLFQGSSDDGMPNELEVCRTVLTRLQQRNVLQKTSDSLIDVCAAGLCTLRVLASSSIQARAWVLRHKQEFEQVLQGMPTQQNRVVQLQADALQQILDSHRSIMSNECFRVLHPSEEHFADHDGLRAPSANSPTPVRTFISFTSREQALHPFVAASRSFAYTRDCWAGVFRNIIAIDVNQVDYHQTVVIDLADEYHIRSCFHADSLADALGRQSGTTVISQDILFLARDITKPAIPVNAIRKIMRLPLVVPRTLRPFYPTVDFPNSDHVARAGHEDGIKLLEHLPGESFPIVVEYQHRRYVASSGKRRHYCQAPGTYPTEPVEAEFYASQLYSLLGCLVPRSCLYMCQVSFNHDQGRQPALVPLLLTEFIDGASIGDFLKQLEEMAQEKAQATWLHVQRSLRNGYLVDCLLSNAAVVSANQRNVVVDRAFRPWRVDFSACLHMEPDGRLTPGCGTQTVVDISALRKAVANQVPEPHPASAEYHIRRIFGLFTDAELVRMQQALPEVAEFDLFLSLLASCAGAEIYAPWLRARLQSMRKATAEPSRR